MKSYAERLEMARNLNREESDICSWWFIGILILVGICAFVGLDKYGLFDVDEAIFAQATQEMLASGDFATPTYNGEPRYHKPPLTYWAQAAVHVAGVDSPVLMSRIASAGFGFLTVIVFFLFLESMTRNNKFAITASAILGLNWLFIGVARGLAPADSALNFFMLCTVMALIANIFSAKRGFMPLFCVGILCSLGLLTKGPIALLLPGIIVFLVAILKEHPWHNLKRANPFIIAPIAVLGLAPWVIFLQQHGGLDYLREFWLTHNWARFTSDLGNSNSDAWWFYIPVFAVLFIPWSLLLPSAILHIGKDWWERIRSNDALKALPAIGLLWMVLVITVFSFSGTKLVHYILFAFPGAALLIAGRLQDLKTKPIDPLHLLYIIPIVLALALLFLVVPSVGHLISGEPLGGLGGAILGLFDLNHIDVNDPQLLGMLSQNIDYGWGFMALAGVLATFTLIGLGFLAAGKEAALVMLTVATAAQVFITAYAIMPVVYQIQQGGLASIATQIRDHYQPGDSLYFIGIHAPSVRLISGVPFVGLHKPSQLKTTPRTGGGKQMFVFEQENLADFKAEVPRAKTSCAGGFCLSVLR